MNAAEWLVTVAVVLLVGIIVMWALNRANGREP